MVYGAFVVRFVLLFGVRSSVAANSVTLDVLSASGSCGQGLPSILDRDAAMMAATLCRVKRRPAPSGGWPLGLFSDGFCGDAGRCWCCPVLGLED